MSFLAKFGQINAQNVSFLILKYTKVKLMKLFQTYNHIKPQLMASKYLQIGMNASEPPPNGILTPKIQNLRFLAGNR